MRLRNEIQSSLCVSGRHLDKLHRQLAVEGGHLSLHAQLSAADGEGDDLVVGGAVADALEDVQVLHHHVAVETHVKHLEEGGKVVVGGGADQRSVLRSTQTEAFWVKEKQ